MRKTVSMILVFLLISLSITAFAACGTNVASFQSERETFTITFETNGGDGIDSQTVKYGNTAEFPQYPTYSNAPVGDSKYVFLGWYSDEQLTNKFSFYTPITENVVLYAKWEYADPTQGLVYTLLPDNTYEVNCYGDYQSFEYVVVPSEYNHKQVTSIGFYAFYLCHNIKAVYLPESITNISDHAFCGCDNLLGINLPKNLKTIGYMAFTDTGIYDITVPDSVTSIGEYAFASANIRGAKLPENIEAIPSGLFFDCDLLKTYDIPDTVTEIGYSAFGAGGLRSITVPDNVTKIDAYAFSDCSYLTCVILSQNIETIESNTFYNSSNAMIFCKTTAKPSGWEENWDYRTKNVFYSGNWNLSGDAVYNADQTVLLRYLGSEETFSAPKTVKEVAEKAFAFCDSLVYFKTGSNTEKINAYAFFTCINLERADIGDSVSDIGEYVFSNCCYLKEVNLPKNLTAISEGLFDFCEYLETVKIPDSVTSIDDGAFAGCVHLNDITLPENLTEIGANAFNYCNELTTIVIPLNVSTLKSAFDGCGSLTIFCEATQKPTSWLSDWNNGCTVYWGDEWFYVDGIPTINE